MGLHRNLSLLPESLPTPSRRGKASSRKKAEKAEAQLTFDVCARAYHVATIEAKRLSARPSSVVRKKNKKEAFLQAWSNSPPVAVAAGRGHGRGRGVGSHLGLGGRVNFPAGFINKIKRPLKYGRRENEKNGKLLKLT